MAAGAVEDARRRRQLGRGEGEGCRKARRCRSCAARPGRRRRAAGWTPSPGGPPGGRLGVEEERRARAPGPGRTRPPGPLRWGVDGEVEADPEELLLAPGEAGGQLAGVLGRHLDLGVGKATPGGVGAPARLQACQLAAQPFGGDGGRDGLDVQGDVEAPGVGGERLEPARGRPRGGSRRRQKLAHQSSPRRSEPGPYLDGVWAGRGGGHAPAAPCADRQTGPHRARPLLTSVLTGAARSRWRRGRARRGRGGLARQACGGLGPVQDGQRHPGGGQGGCGLLGPAGAGARRRRPRPAPAARPAPLGAAGPGGRPSSARKRAWSRAASSRAGWGSPGAASRRAATMGARSTGSARTRSCTGSAERVEPAGEAGHEGFLLGRGAQREGD